MSHLELVSESKFLFLPEMLKQVQHDLVEKLLDYFFKKGKVILTQVPGYLFVERCDGL